MFDVRLHRMEDRPGPVAQQICNPDRPATYVPGHDRFVRWEFRVEPGETAEEMTDPDRVWELIAPWISPEAGELSRAVVYRFHATVAERFRVGRIFLVGDAAHQMPPFLGQGLCSGLRDVANLAWKLDLVERGVAGGVLLDSYETERRPHAKAVVVHAADVGRLIDQLSGRTDDDVGLDAGYGGGRGFPTLGEGVLVGSGGRIGKPLPQPVIDGRWFDDRLGDGFRPADPEPGGAAIGGRRSVGRAGWIGGRVAGRSGLRVARRLGARGWRHGRASRPLRGRGLCRRCRAGRGDHHPASARGPPWLIPPAPKAVPGRASPGLGAIR